MFESYATHNAIRDNEITFGFFFFVEVDVRFDETDKKKN